MAMEMAPRALPCLVRVPEQRLSVPRISSSVAAALQNFSWLEVSRFRVFASGGFYRRRGKVGGRPGGPHHALERPGGPVPRGGVATLWPLSDSPSGSMSLPVKY